MSIEHMSQTTNMFYSEADALVCPVNCVGVLGAGLARVFAGRFRGMVNPYKHACDTGALRPGRVFVITTGGKDVVCVPTKNHWVYDSNLDQVVEAIGALGREADNRQWKALAIPALGCGLGRLSYEPVKEALVNTFLLRSTHALLFPPR